MFEPIAYSKIHAQVLGHMMRTGHEMPIAMCIVALQNGVPPFRVHLVGTPRPPEDPGLTTFIEVDPVKFRGRASMFPRDVVVIKMLYSARVIGDFVLGTYNPKLGQALLYSLECFKLDA